MPHDLSMRIALLAAALVVGCVGDDGEVTGQIAAYCNGELSLARQCYGDTGDVMVLARCADCAGAVDAPECAPEGCVSPCVAIAEDCEGVPAFETDDGHIRFGRRIE